jgi:hypothetical protein
MWFTLSSNLSVEPCSTIIFPRELQRVQTPLSRSYIEIWALLVDRSHIEFACLHTFCPNPLQPLSARLCVEVDHLGFRASDRDALGHQPLWASTPWRYCKPRLIAWAPSLYEQAIVTYSSPLERHFHWIGRERREFTASPDAFARLCITFFSFHALSGSRTLERCGKLSHRLTPTLHKRGDGDGGGGGDGGSRIECRKLEW